MKAHKISCVWMSKAMAQVVRHNHKEQVWFEQLLLWK